MGVEVSHVHVAVWCCRWY